MFDIVQISCMITLVAPQETKCMPAHPEEAFPGVPAWRMDIAPVGDAPVLTPQAKQLLSEITQTSNLFFDVYSRSMISRESNEFFTIHEPYETVRKYINRLAEAIYTTTIDNPNVHLVFFPAGSIPIADRIKQKGYPMGRMHAVDISGSIGTETGSAMVKGKIPKVLLDPEIDIVIPEDIIDSMDSIFQFIKARGIYRDPSKEHVTWLLSLEKRLKAAHTNGNKDKDTYKDFVRAAAEERVSILSIWSKNRETHEALYTSKSTIQKRLVMEYTIVSLPATMWVLGGNYVMDTGILWSRILKQLPDDLQHDPRVKEYIGPNGQWLLRGVRIGPLAYFETKEQEQHVVDRIAGFSAALLKNEVQ